MAVEHPLQILWLVPLGLFAGGYGILIGAGGGFLYVPALVYGLRFPVLSRPRPLCSF